MAGISKSERLARIHDEALTQFNRAESAVREVRLQCLEARRFYSIPGAQWDGAWGEQYRNKPMLEANVVHLAVIRIINEYRNNRVEVIYTPKDGDKDETAEVCNGLYRADAQDSGALEARNNAFEEAVGGGIGAWRLKTVYENEEDDEDERQRIVWEPIVDADTCVFFDPNAKRQDKRDAKFCFVLTQMTRDAYIDEYGDDPASWPKGITSDVFDWAPLDAVYVAEYYKVVDKKQKVYCYVDIAGNEREYYEEDLKDEEELLAEIKAMGFTLKEEPKIRHVRKVHKYIMSGGGILEDCGYIAGKYIPIIINYGKRWYVDGVERCMGHVQLCMDVQRLKNVMLTKLAEISARPSVEKPVVTPGQIAGHAQMWADDNLEDYPYLMLNAELDANGNPMQPQLQYTRAPQIPPALAALLQITNDDLQQLLGNQQAGEEVQPNISGKVVELIQNRLDMQSFIYMSNFADYAVKYEGMVWLSMANEIYVEAGRRMKSLASDDKSVSSVVLNEGAYDDERGHYEKNDISKAKYDVYVDVGPTSSSKRASTVRTLTGLMQITGAVDPQTTQLLASAVLLNVEGEGLQDIRDYKRAQLVRQGVLKPTEEEKEQMAQEQANAQPDPQAAFLLAEAEKAQAAAVKAQADTGKALADTEKIKAETAATLAAIPRENAQAAIDAAKALNDLTTPKEPNGTASGPSQ